MPATIVQRRRGRILGTALGISAAAMICSSASAGLVLPDGFNIICEWEGNVWMLSNNPDDFKWIPTDKGGGTVVGESATKEWSATWDGTGFGTNSTSVFGNFSFTNTSGQTATFTVTVTAPLTQVLLGQTQIQGSIGGSLVDSGGGGATVAAPAGGSIYNALVDGNSVRTLMDDPFSFSVPAGQADSIPSQSFPWEPGPFGAFTSIAIEHTFTLTPGDGVTFSSAFHIIPAPGAIAVFALAGIFGKRRRRD